MRAACTRAAVEKGIVPGGGVASGARLADLLKLKADNEDQRRDRERSPRRSEPLRQFAANGGETARVSPARR